MTVMCMISAIGKVSQVIRIKSEAIRKLNMLHFFTEILVIF
jgi:hypothetical protein